MARCLNPLFPHENASNTITCQQCEYLVQGAHIGAYEVTGFIGTGSYGHVYKIREPNPLERTLALKVLRMDQASARSNFFQEARRIANMQHSYILPIYGFGLVEDSQQPYFVMEYAPRTIYDLFITPTISGVPARRFAYAEELIPYIQQCALALSFVHDNGYVHQDVKPANLLIGRSGQILLADFGTAYYLGMQTHASLGEITGTAAYMPPEQWQGAPRRASDQYALAICCYELLSGRTPFNYRQLDAMFQAHLKEQPPEPQRWNARIPVEVSAVLLRALSKDHRQRYVSIDEFAQHYSNAVEIALQRYRCQLCGQQNRTGAQRCAFCGAAYDGRICQYCAQPVRFGQRCCSHCGRLALAPASLRHNPLIGVSIRQERYTLQRILQQDEETGIVVAQASDERTGRIVVLKRWECASTPLAQRASDIAHYERATQPLTLIRHPLASRIRDRFAEGPYYYAIMDYIDGESLAERLLRQLRPVPEREVLNYLNTLLNILEALASMQPAIYHFDISPNNILIERQRGRIFLTGFQVPPPPQPQGRAIPLRGRPTTRKLAISPYQPLQDRPFDQRSCMYALAASMHHALTNVAPPHYPTYPPVRLLNPAISPALEYILSRALLEDPQGRYQSYREMRADVQHLLA